jgi:hypothetical protein
VFRSLSPFALTLLVVFSLANAQVVALPSSNLASEGGEFAINADNAAFVTVHPSNHTVGADQTVMFTAAASGTPTPTVQWQVSANNGLSWDNVSGANSADYSFLAAIGDSGKQFRAAFANGGDTITTNAATLTVISNPSVTCGQTITADTTFNSDVFCPPDTQIALVIGASNITLDLGGHVLSGYAPVDFVSRGIVAAQVVSIIIRNGTVEEFDEGVDVFDSRYVTVENLLVKNLRITDINHFVAGVNIAGSDKVVIRDSRFEFTPVVFHKEAIDIYGSDVSVGNIEVHGGLGVNFSFNGTCDPVNSPNSGEVLNSRFVDSVAGVLVACSNGARIAGNDFDCPSAPGACEGIRVYGPFAGAVTGVRADGNTIRNGFTGINWEGIRQSTVTNNTVSGNTGWGIGLRQTQGEDGQPISYPFGNTIYGNIVWGNATDLYDDGTGQENTWASNVCMTKQGATIPACSGLTIITHPLDQRVIAGTNASFLAEATYGGWMVNPPPVQWQISNNGGSTWADVSGAISATYSFTVSIGDNGKQFRAVFTNSSTAATTNAATLTVSAFGAGPDVTTHPSDHVSVDGKKVTFSAAANGTPTPSVQWQVSTNKGMTWVDIVTKATSLEFSFAAANSDSGKRYRALFSNSMGTATTNAALLTVISRAAATDFDGDGKADLTVWRSSSGIWYTLPSNSPSNYTSTQWGIESDIPVSGDYDGDGKSDIAVWRPSNGVWYIRPSNAGGYTATSWGTNGDVPVSGDYDGEGKADVAVWRPSTGVWYILLSGTPGSYTAKQWGLSTDIPVPGDYDGDGKADVAVWRPSTGIWYVLNSGTAVSYTSTQWGVASDVPTPGDYDADGTTDIAVWRPSSGVWYIRPSKAGGYTATSWGTIGDTPVTGDFDSDSKSDVAVWRSSNGTWYVLSSRTPGSYTARQWGMAGDMPISPLAGILNSIP